MTATYAEAPSVQFVADGLIPEFHPHLADPRVKIVYLFVDPVPMSGGKEVWGRCVKVSGRNAYLADPENGDTFFVLEIAEAVWNVLTPDQRRALVDHELSHAAADEDEKGELKLTIKPHDVEEFADVIRRHGLWHDEAKRLVNAALEHDGRPRLFGEEEQADEEAA